ncbi:MAG: GFA family protein [Bdellovibrio sp.]|nr:GFA family protein [Bdellovibrio sp.]
MANIPASKYSELTVARPITGGCLCGGLRYECTGKPLIAFHCQCQHCQKLSSTGHGSYILLSKSETKVTGNFSIWSYTADSGNTTTKHFCPKCGTQVFSLTSGHQNNFIASASSLDDKSLFLPSLVLFAKHASPWDQIDNSLPRYSGGA